MDKDMVTPHEEAREASAATDLPGRAQEQRRRLMIGGTVAVLLVLAGGIAQFSSSLKRQTAPEEWALPPEAPTPIPFEESPIVDDVSTVTPDIGVTTYEYPQLTPDTTDYSSYYDTLVPQDGVIWLPHPERVEVPYPLFVCGGEACAVSFGGEAYESAGVRRYYRVGTYYGTKDIVYTNSFEGDPSGVYPALFLWDKQRDTFEFLKNHSAPLGDGGGYVALKLNTGITVNDTLTLSALMVPKTVLVGGGVLTHGYQYTDFFSQFLEVLESASLELVGKTPYGPVFKKVSGGEDEVSKRATVMYALRLPGGLMASLSYTEPFIPIDGIPLITWNDGTKNTVMYRGAMGGCGWGDTAVVTPSVPSDALVVAGKADTGEVIYTLKDQNHPLINEVIEMSGGLVYSYEDGMMQSRTFAREEFMAERGVIVYMDTFGEQRTRFNMNYGPQAECGKPVVYLYPEATTTVQVSVDAIITKSEPTYATGWTVDATPEGVLMHDSGVYRSLYWDGYGRGTYPAITEGIIVPSGEALSTMESQMYSMGFNADEIADFSAFWNAHIPTQPYTRISWFFTRDMEQLAKLTVTPRPDTVFRAFVDFEGLDMPNSIPPQRLPHFTRTGFTVTEWGGLLRTYGATR